MFWPRSDYVFKMDATYNLNGGFKPTTKRFADLHGPDFFPTPAWATYALTDNERFRGDIWEPACGDGSMARVLETTGCRVMASDLFDRGYGEIGIDFLNTTQTFDNIVTNPPYNAAEGFVQSGIQHSRLKFALLLRLAFLEGKNRQKTIFNRYPPTRVWVFSSRYRLECKRNPPRSSHASQQPERRPMLGLYGTKKLQREPGVTPRYQRSSNGEFRSRTPLGAGDVSVVKLMPLS